MLFDENARAEAELAIWLARARQGDRHAFARLVRAHQSRVRLQLRRLAHGDAALADDLAQETFVQAWLHLAEFRGDARLATWLHRIALTRFLQHVRRPQLPREWCEPEADAGPSHDPRPAEGLVRDVERALQALSEIQRLAVVHCFHLDLSHAEAAQVLGLPLGTLKSHLDRAKQRLRQLLGAWNPEAA
ncbi:MAG: sigma-70 family RNA polymerase sigma factor [Caulobacter sp.]|nr:sigma-70 family RNA polymerase sigma factor [Vitreoscilla sp.]